MTTQRPRGTPRSAARAEDETTTEAVEETTEESVADEAPVEEAPRDDYFDAPYAIRLNRAGYGEAEGEEGGAVPRTAYEKFDFRTPDDPEIPRNVRDMQYAHLEAAIRAMSFPVEVVTTTVVQQPFELPAQHRLSGTALQKLMTALIAAQSSGGELPDWHTFRDPESDVEEAASVLEDAVAEADAEVAAEADTEAATDEDKAE